MTTVVDSSRPDRLEARDVRVYYEGVRAVDGVSLSLDMGEILGLIGPNGAGKSTLMKAIGGFAPLTTGSISVGGVDASARNPERVARLGVLRTFQDVATFPRLTVMENVEVGALGAGLGRRAARRRARDVVRQLSLEHVASRAAWTIPHGEERLLGIARAVARGPRFLLLDEPAAGLNDGETAHLGRTILSLRDELGCGVLLVEHDMPVIFSVCERIQVLDEGRVIALGSPDEIANDLVVAEAYLGQKGAKLAHAQ